MHGVDDAYFCGGSFWDGLGDRPTLRQIAERAVETLRGPLPLDEADRERWRGRGGRGAAQASSLSQHRGPLWCRLAAEAQAAGKLRVVDEYRRMARCPDLVAPAPVLRAEWLVPALRPLVAGDAHAPPSSGEALLRAARAEPLADGIVAFDLFEPRFCELLLAEADADEASLAPHDPPNTMNRGGLIVNEIGLEPLMDLLLRRLIAPLAAHLYSAEPFAASLDHHHSFVVAYRHRGDELDMHHDASEATLNVCLGREGFTGGGLRFCGRFGGEAHRRNVAVADHAVGRATLHLGRQRHGADDLTSGERLNLIVWARSSAFRAAAAYGYIAPDGYPKEPEQARPDLECLSLANDDDYHEQRARQAPSGEG
ncbi:hypothetical protein EMIHUDRAFT_207311 [Emiliania huxleyi CCMP1516]|uniref:Fe2OG dioxygenase domain-containing protein n=2 Tax=Emiliania huxleyi TaxID=2903 RepID=A0A0D3JF91_EMIH1|nr:hypothetical protein EMIHUDRAFT_207311 [Emiliania huxleyi CCMP1516]EOD22176.1 hypothetical protein EMIHUDRAFT_207311 [Emiliania huxleyi CCMP1516]|eukprot:XP_005774605.1 hypothetical protein EMIHUDRAFT_207311 [Emiliania huxleyi CCMP1516]